MAVSPEALRAAITDFKSYPEFVAEVVSAKAQKPKGGKQKVSFQIEVIKSFEYTLEFDLSRENEIHWKLVDSNFFTTNEGAWILTPAKGGKTKVRYELEVGVKFLVPGFVAKKLTEVSLPKLLESFEERAKTLH